MDDFKDEGFDRRFKVLREEEQVNEYDLDWQVSEDMLGKLSVLCERKFILNSFIFIDAMKRFKH